MFCQPLGKFQNFTNLVEEVRQLILKIDAVSPSTQISLQVKDENDNSPDSWFSSTGRIRQQNRLIIEPQYKYIHPELKGGYIDQWIQSITDYRIVRTRLLKVNPRSCYSIHSDPYPRIHIPVITNPQCLICFPDQGIMEHLSADGNSYYVDTTKKHTFINCSEELRVHLVGVALPKSCSF
jgi:hypothetical protein